MKLLNQGIFQNSFHFSHLHNWTAYQSHMTGMRTETMKIKFTIIETFVFQLIHLNNVMNVILYLVKTVFGLVFSISAFFRGVHILLHTTQLYQRPGIICKRLLLDRPAWCYTWCGISPLAFAIWTQVPALCAAGLRWNHVHSCFGLGVPCLHAAHFRAQFPASRDW